MAAYLQALAFAMLVLAVVPLACMALVSKTLQDRCESYAGGDRGSFDYDYCVWTLHRDNKSATADELGLAVIAARMARATAKATAAKIAALQANETLPPARRYCLAACVREYAAAVRRLGHAAGSAAAARAGTGNGNNNLQRAQTLLTEATGTPARCGAAFAAARQDAPLADGDFGLDDQIALAVALLPPPPPPPSSPPDVA